MSNKNISQIIQIPLYQYLEVSTSSILKTMGIAIVASFVTSIVLYFLLPMQNVLLHLGTMSLILLIVLLIKYMDYLFPTTDITLILAHNELYLMKSDKIQAFEKRQNVVIETIQNTKISIIQIIGTDFPKMTIAYFLNNKNGQTNREIVPIDFIIYKKTDWTQLLQQLKTPKNRI